MKIEYHYDVLSEIAILHTYPNGHCKKLCIISWNGQPPVYDIRTWFYNFQGELKPGEGTSLTKDEMAKLATIIRNAKP